MSTVSETWAATWVVCAKELRIFCRDKTGLMLAIALPIALVTVFGFVMKLSFGSDSGVPRVALWIADEDQSDRSAALIAALRKSPMLSVRPQADAAPLEIEGIQAKVAQGDATHGLVLDAGFEAAVLAGTEPPMRLIRDPGRTMEDQIVRMGISQSFLSTTGGKLWPTSFARQMRSQGMSEGDAENLRLAAVNLQQRLGGASGSTASTDGNGTFNVMSFMDGMVSFDIQDITPPERDKNLDYMLAQSISGVSVMMLMFGIMGIASTLLAEREEGTLQRLLVSGMPRSALLWGKALCGTLIGVVQLIVLLVYGSILFQVDLLRDPLTLGILALAWACAAMAFGMVIATWAKSRKQAEGIATLLILVMAAVGGCWFPVQMAGDLGWFDVVTHSTITYWAMTGFQNLFWRGASITDQMVWGPVLVLLGFTVAAMLIARALYFRRFVRTS